MTTERLVSRGYTNAEKTRPKHYRPDDVVAFHRPYKRLGVENRAAQWLDARAHHIDYTPGKPR